MNNYSEVLKTAKDLRDDFKDKISVAESLQIAAQIQISEVLTRALTITHSETPEPLEAIAMALGQKPIPLK